MQMDADVDNRLIFAVSLRRLTLLILLSSPATVLTAQAPEQGDFLSQEFFIRKITERTESYNSDFPAEKIYIHFDRPYYLAGDTAWFNIYIADTELHPSKRSIVVFVDWFYKDGSLIKHQQFKVTDGKAAGNIFFDLPTGRYTARAYTNAIAELSPDHVYYTSLNLIDPSKLPSPPTPNISNALSDIQFFPESGNLVTGVESRVAFKAIDGAGRAVDFTGQITDDLNKTIATIKSTHRGMGSFTLKAEDGRSYKAKVNNVIFSLPKPIKSGLIMNVDPGRADTIQVRIQATDDLLPAAFYLIGQSRGKIYYRDMFTMTESEMVLKIARKSIPAGVMQLTLFDENSKPLCERMIFQNRGSDLKVEVTFNKKTYAPRELVLMDIVVKDKNDAPVQTQVSVSVTDAAWAFDHSLHENIRTQLLLQSDLKGDIEDLSWYFESDIPEKYQALDLVMLTHRWRRYNWEQILAEKRMTKRYVVEKGITIAGRVVAIKNAPISNAGITLLTHNNGIYTATADVKGNFSIHDFIYDGSSTLLWQIRDKKGKQIDASIIFTMPELPRVDSARLSSNILGERAPLPEKEVTSALQNLDVLNFYRAKVLKEVEIKGTRLENGKQGNSLIQEDYHRLFVKPTEEESMNYTDVTKLISDKFPNVTFLGTGINLDARIRGVNKRLMYENEVSPMILLDGQVINADSIQHGGVYHALNLVPVSEIAKIEVLSIAAASIYGSRASGGVIALYTKGGSGKVAIDKTGPGKGILKVVPPGYDVPGTFYQPKYVQGTHQQDTDYRTTLFWDAGVHTDDSGKVQIRFYNSDVARSFTVVVEGIVNGSPFMGVK